MQAVKTNILTALTAGLIIYAIAITYQGYHYGQGDQSQILPVLLEQDHPGTYTRDHYVHAYLESGINERTVFHFLLRHAGYQYPWAVFIWHALFSVALFTAWIFIAAQFIKSRLLQYLTVAAIVTIGFHFSTGLNEIYYPSLVPSLCAKSLASWALLAWIRDRYWSWMILLFVAALIQPLVGLQLFIITAAGMGIYMWEKKEIRDFPWLPSVIFIAITLPWVYLLAINNGGHSDPSRFVSILEFRLSHHFFGSYFPPLQLAATFILTAIAIRYYEGRLRWMFITTAIGILVYELGAEVLNMTFIFYSQWWKTTIWIEAFAFIAIGGFLERKLPFLANNRFNPAMIMLIILGLTAVYRTSEIRGVKPDYMLPFMRLKTDETDISVAAKKLTSRDALFLVPPELSAFRWYSHRSNFVDYKAMVHTEEFLFNWYDRLEAAYGYNESVWRNGFSIYQWTRQHFDEPSTERINKWRDLGITHVITYSETIPGLSPVAWNKTYALYPIQ